MSANDRFDCSIKRGHQTMLANVVGRMQAGQVFVPTAQELKDLGDLAGQLNKCASEVFLPTNIHPEISFGDYDRRLFAASTEVIDVFPFRIVAGTSHIGLSEYQGQPWTRLMTVSTVPGDLYSAIRSEGKAPDIFISGNVEFPIGTPLYINTILTQEPTVPNSSGSGISIVWP